MKTCLLNDNLTTLTQAAQARFKPHWALQILLFLAVFIVSQIICAIPMGIAFMLTGDGAGPEQMWLMLVLLVFSIAATLIYTRFIEGRSMASVGFVRKGAVKQYLAGIAVGSAMIWASLGICLATGTATFEGAVTTGSAGSIALLLAGFLIQGMQEEVMCRGYMMVSLTNRTTVFAAIMINSLVFAAMHLWNPGVTPLACVNLVLFGVFASCYFLRTDNIWGIGAIHSVWNFSMGNLMGIEVSGTDAGPTVMRFAATEHGTIINGGTFGLEGGLAVTIVFTVGTLALLFLPRKR